MAQPYTSTALTSTVIRSNIRTDLNDLDNTNYRWVDATIDRMVDRALTRYSQVAPWLELTQLSTIAGSRLYASPSGAWRIDRVEYPLSRWPKNYLPFRQIFSPLLQNPSTAISAVGAVAGGGSLGAGVYQYAYTFTNPGSGETLASSTVSVTASANGQVSLGSIPLGPYGTTGRNIYRTTVGTSQLKLLKSLADNTTSTYTDGAADGTLGVNAPLSNTTQGIPLFELHTMSPAFLPADATGILEVTYATKHLLDTTGTTVPNEHWDALYAGAEMYLVEQWLGSVLDNFEWVDGQFRDKVDDTKSMIQWQAFYTDLAQKFERRIRQIEEQMNASVMSVVRWGDKPIRWDRL